MPTVRLVGLTKRFGGKEAIKNLNLEVKDKEFFCVLGYPGAGKTTLLRLICGLERPDEGEIYIGDKLVNDIHPGNRDIAMIFQNLALYPDKTVFDNVAFPLRIQKRPKDEIEKRVKEVARTLNISYLLDRTPATLSGGERQRVAIGRALVRRPQVFLLDEPLTNLDALLRVGMRVELRRLQMELGQTIIGATPDQLEAMSMSDRIGILREGTLQQTATPDEIYEHPANTFVAGLIGSPPMNLVDCTYEEGDGKAYLNLGPSRIEVTKLKHAIKNQSTSSELILGFRPEDMEVKTERPSKEALEATFHLVEPLGSKLILHLSFADRVIKAIASIGFSVRYGSRVWFDLPVDKIFIFDKKTEKAVV